jgi:hypothetical protein
MTYSLTEPLKLIAANPSWGYGEACGYADGYAWTMAGNRPDPCFARQVDDYAHGYRRGVRDAIARGANPLGGASSFR